MFKALANVNLTLVTGEKIIIPYGENNRCDNCGKNNGRI